MATVTKPVALNESLNTTDSTPKNIADVLKDKLGDIASAISGGGGGSGGHIIQNASGANMPQESTMQFKDSHVTDNSQADKTEVEVIKSVASADYSSETEDGLYLIPDGEGSVIEPASDDYVEVTTDGVKTYAELLDELAGKVDFTKVGVNSCLVYAGIDVYLCVDFNSNNGEISFSRSTAYNSSTYFTIARPIVSTSGSTWYEYRGNSIYNNGVNKPSSGRKITLYYGNKKAVVDLQTTANRCWYDSENTVKDILKKTVSVLDYQADYAYNAWTTHTKTFTELTTIENAFISIIGGWTTSSPHEATIVTISGNTVTYACKGMWSGGSSGITVMITAIGK